MSAGPTCWPTPNARAPWTDEDERDLKEMIESGWTHEECAEALSRPHKAVQNRACLMRAPTKTKWRKWDSSEVQFLIARMADMSDALGRSPGAIAKKMRELYT